MNNFKSLQLYPSIEKALDALNFHTPTPIQQKAIPVALNGKDVIGCAQTGTGKTAAFCIPILMELLKSKDKTALILAPTRELVQQIELFWRSLNKFNPEIRSVLLIGGASMGNQFRELARRPRVVIATPGRLCDHLNRKTIKLDLAGLLVLDEADRMLDMGFAPQLSIILRHLPRQRQNFLFSATWDASVDGLARKYLRHGHDVVKVSAGEVSQAAKSVDQEVVTTTAKQKNEALLDELNQRKGSILVFARTQVRTERVTKYLASYGVNVNQIHGGRTQGQRNTAMTSFRSGKTRVLVATDIAARGIDVADISYVINYDLPQCPEDYIHRIGRTGRAGLVGTAISFVTPEDRGQWKRITRLLQKSGSTVPKYV